MKNKKTLFYKNSDVNRTPNELAKPIEASCFMSGDIIFIKPKLSEENLRSLS